MANIDQVDVLIIGAGPAGLTLANSLRGHDLKVRIVERRRHDQMHGHADGLKYVALEILESLGLGGLIENEVHHVEEVALWESNLQGEIFRSAILPDIVPGLNKRREVTLAQARIEAILKHKLMDFCPIEYATVPVSLEFNEEAVMEQNAYPVKVCLRRLDGLRDVCVDGDSIDQPDSSVEVVRAKYVVGCDGTQSWTRSAVGISVNTNETDSIWGAADIIPKTNFPDIRKSVTARSLASGSLLIMPREGKLVRLYVSLGHHSQTLSKDPVDSIICRQITETAEKILYPYSLEAAHCEWSSIYRARQQIATSFSRWNRVFLVGDAVHAHSPKTGQGMNTSIQDAYNLGWKLGACLKWGASPSILTTYQAERMPIAQQLIDDDKYHLELYPVDGNKGRADEEADSKNSVTSDEFQERYLRGLSETANAYLQYDSNMLIWNDYISYQAGSSTPGRVAQYSAKIVPGKRLHDFTIVNQSNGLACSIHQRLHGDGRFRLLVFPGDIVASDQLESYQRLAINLTSLLNEPNSCYYGRDEAIDSRLEVLTIHTAERLSVELLSLPEVYHPWTERFGWDYWKIYCAGNDKSQASSLYKNLGIPPEGNRIVLVRPDGHIAMIQTFEGLTSINRYFTAFLPPKDAETASLPEGLNSLNITSNVKPLILWSHARTTSNLFMKIFSSHPDLSTLAYPFHDAFMWGPEQQRLRRNKEVTELEATIDHQKMSQETYQHAFNRLSTNLENVFQQGKVPLIKEHVYFVTKPKVFQDHLSPRFIREVLCTPSITTKASCSDSDDCKCITSEVSPNNPTFVPDAVLRSFRPVFIIRHPILMISSMYRAASKSLGATVDDPDFPMNATLRWSRLLFEWYLQQLANPKSDSVSPTSSSSSSLQESSSSSDRPWDPVVIDAADLINNTDLICKQLADLAGLSDAQLQLSWKPLDPEHSTNNMVDTFQNTIRRSSGVIRSNLSTEEILTNERARWPYEFGPKVAERLDEFVRDALPDYLFMWERRLR